jgi:fatty acid elongase 3
MAPLADFILANVPLPSVPSYLTRWEPGKTPLSTDKEVITALVSYLAVVFGIRHVMKDRPAVRANGPFQVHNTFLYVGSGLLLALILEEILPIWWHNDWFHAICNEKSWTKVSYLRSCLANSADFSPAARILLYDQLLLQVC